MVDTVASRVLEKQRVFVTAPTISQNFSRATESLDTLAGPSCAERMCARVALHAVVRSMRRRTTLLRRLRSTRPDITSRQQIGHQLNSFQRQERQIGAGLLVVTRWSQRVAPAIRSSAKDPRRKIPPNSSPDLRKVTCGQGCLGEMVALFCQLFLPSFLPSPRRRKSSKMVCHRVTDIGCAPPIHHLTVESQNRIIPAATALSIRLTTHISPQSCNSTRISTRSSLFMSSSSAVARPTAVIPSIRAPTIAKCSFHACSRGWKSDTMASVSGSTALRFGPL